MYGDSPLMNDYIAASRAMETFAKEHPYAANWSNAKMLGTALGGASTGAGIGATFGGVPGAFLGGAAGAMFPLAAGKTAAVLTTNDAVKSRFGRQGPDFEMPTGLVPLALSGTYPIPQGDF